MMPSQSASEPSEERSSVPSLSPSDEPSSKPSMKASEMPSSNSSEPSSNPSNSPSSLPSMMLSQSASPTGTGLPLVYKGENLESYYECEGDCDDSRDCDVSCILNTLYEVARFIMLDTDISELTICFFAPMLRLVGSQLLRAIWYPKRPRMQWDRPKRKGLLLCTSGWGTSPHGQ
jgi:hypothetical protein